MDNLFKNEINNIKISLSSVIVEKVFELINLYIKSTPNKIDDLIITFLPKAKEYILDKINN